jgi:mono/diheme cytochrome c family protein
MSQRVRCVVASLIAIIVLGALGAAAFVYSGLYDIAATEQHTPPVYWLIEATMRRAVHARSSLEPVVPDVSSPEVLERGLGVYHAQCERCHGAPGVAPEHFALGMTPTPANLTETAQRWSTADIYWVIKYGMKMTGMPAWQYRLNETEMRDVAAFVSRELRDLSPADYRGRAGEAETRTARPSGPALRKSAGIDESKRAIQQYACATCHRIPGITAATKDVGPSLDGIAGRTFIAGVLSNTRENMVTWLMSPPRVKPHTAMPDLGVTTQDAHAIAAYLELLQ